MKFVKSARWTFGVLSVFLFLLSLPGSGGSDPAEYAKLKKQGERFYERGSYARAHEVYRKADALKLPPPQESWVDFRVADTLWRAQAGTRTADPSIYEKARRQLESLIDRVQRVEERDRVWAEAQESLGDFWWLRRDFRNWGRAWKHYREALDWWGGQSDIDRARKRYLHIVWTVSSPPWREPFYYPGYYGNNLPLEILENVLKIARTPEDRQRGHFLMAMTLRNQTGWNQRERVAQAFEAAIEAGKKFDWYDDALFYYGEWLSQYGDVIILDSGRKRWEGDYVEAVKIFRRLLDEFQKGETRHYDPARRRIENITRPTLGLEVPHIFLPDSRIRIQTHWRNVDAMGFSVYPVDLTRDVTFSDKKDVHAWLYQINLPLKTKLLSWSEETGDTGKHKPGQKQLLLDKKLPPGAYIIEATGNGQTTRDLILVTDAALVLKASGTQALVYFCDVQNGAPLPQAQVSLWERYNNGRKWVWKVHSAETDSKGLAAFELKSTRSHGELFASANLENRQAFSTGSSTSFHGRKAEWKIYAHTDRPAYRPEDTAHWRITARTYTGSVYETPSGEELTFELTDPQGTKVQEGTLKLNEFGSARQSLDLTASMPLGEYKVSFWTGGKKKFIGRSAIFRLEEYKLPEFKVRIDLPEEDGKKKTYRLGDKVQVDIDAEYYFGGPVTDANVEVLVTQRPFRPIWRPLREYPWYYRDMRPRFSRRWGGGQQVKREVLKTDARGRASFSFETPVNGQDTEYRIEARVVDASRREVVVTDSVRVTRQSYSVHLRPGHHLYRPQDQVAVTIKTLDANHQPVSAEGRLTVTRDFWFEIWIDPDGNEVQGDALQDLKRKSSIFPPPAPPGKPGWRLKFRGYQHDEILARSVKTGADGAMKFTHIPDQEGYYRFTWFSQVPGEPPIQSSTTVWVATPDTRDLGYRHGGVEIIADKDTFRSGQTAPVMLVTDTPDRYVLFGVEGDDLYSVRLVHLEGTVKLVELEIEETHVPNVFLTAVMVRDREIFRDVEEVIVPPVKHFLNVSVKPDQPEYPPGTEGTLTVTTRDHLGNPVPAEVAVSLVDESVFYIQKEIAPDPREFFYGDKRPHRIQTANTFQAKPYARLVKDAEGRWIDDRRLRLQRRESAEGLGEEREDLAAGFKSGGRQMKRAPVSKTETRRFEAQALKESADAARPPEDVSGEAAGKEPSVQVRTDFRATALWKPGIVTDENGKATLKVSFPDSLSEWRATARAATRGNRFGIATSHTQTRKPLMVRLQAPRFFVVGDVLTLSAIINNQAKEPLTVLPEIKAQGITLTGMTVRGKKLEMGKSSIKIPAGEALRVDWTAAVKSPGHVRLRVTAKSESYADGMEKSFLVHEHGIEKFIAKSGKMKGDRRHVALTLPPERKPGSTRVTVQMTPSLAVTLLDALPYLVDYPYGCTEQTLSRFLPSVITLRTLSGLGLKPESVADRMFGGLEPEAAGKTHPQGKKDLKRLKAMVGEGLSRLYDFQHSDGGWGWWKDGDSDPFMTAYVLWGLAVAREAGAKVDADALARGVRYLDRELVTAETRLDRQAWMLHALSVSSASAEEKKPTPFQTRALENLWKNRDRLNAYSRSLLALAAHRYGEVEKAKVLVENLENGVKLDTTPDTSIVQRGDSESQEGALTTAHWGEDGIYWRWSEGGVEATAFALQALLTIDPENKLIEPVTHWLIKNRRGAHWSNTRDTAIAVLTLNDYLKTSGELDTDTEVELAVNGSSLIKTRFAEVLRAPSRFSVDPALLKDGTNEIQLRRTAGEGPIYFSVEGRYFSREEPVPAAGSEIFLRRQYFKLVGRPTLLKGWVYDKQPLGDGDRVKSGQRIETVITLETKNNAEYLVIEDLKPAGLEAVNVRSGEALYARELKSSALPRTFQESRIARSTERREPILFPSPENSPSDYTGRTRWVYQELRDRKVVLFLSDLPEGVWEIRYLLRAEVPGTFHALPVLGHAMYIPEIRANGAESRFTVEDRDD